eukprot:scaffold49619_cov35-Attheya_sp.AAC.2
MECIDGALNVLGPAVLFVCKVVYSVHNISKEYTVSRKVMAALLQLEFCDNKRSVHTRFSTYFELLNHVNHVFVSMRQFLSSSILEKEAVVNSVPKHDVYSHGIQFEDVVKFNSFCLEMYDTRNGILKAVDRNLSYHKHDTVTTTPKVYNRSFEQSSCLVDFETSVEDGTDDSILSLANKLLTCKNRRLSNIYNEFFRRNKLDDLLIHTSAKSTSTIPEKEAVVDVAWIPINYVDVDGANLESPVYVIRNPISRSFETELWQVYDHLPFSKYNKVFGRRIRISSPFATSQDLYFHIGANNAIYTGVPTHPMEVILLDCLNCVMKIQDDLIEQHANGKYFSRTIFDVLQCAVGQGYGPHNDAGPHTHDGSRGGPHSKLFQQTLTFCLTRRQKGSSDDKEIPYDSTKLVFYDSLPVENEDAPCTEVDVGGECLIHIQGSGLQDTNFHSVKTSDGYERLVISARQSARDYQPTNIIRDKRLLESGFKEITVHPRNSHRWNNCLSKYPLGDECSSNHFSSPTKKNIVPLSCKRGFNFLHKVSDKRIKIVSDSIASGTLSPEESYNIGKVIGCAESISQLFSKWKTQQCLARMHNGLGLQVHHETSSGSMVAISHGMLRLNDLFVRPGDIVNVEPLMSMEHINPSAHHRPVCSSNALYCNTIYISQAYRNHFASFVHQLLNIVEGKPSDKLILYGPGGAALHVGSHGPCEPNSKNGQKDSPGLLLPRATMLGNEVKAIMESARQEKGVHVFWLINDFFPHNMLKFDTNEGIYLGWYHWHTAGIVQGKDEITEIPNLMKGYSLDQSSSEYVSFLTMPHFEVVLHPILHELSSVNLNTHVSHGSRRSIVGNTNILKYIKEKTDDSNRTHSVFNAGWKRTPSPTFIDFEKLSLSPLVMNSDDNRRVSLHVTNKTASTALSIGPNRITEEVILGYYIDNVLKETALDENNPLATSHGMSDVLNNRSLRSKFKGRMSPTEAIDCLVLLAACNAARMTGTTVRHESNKLVGGAVTGDLYVGCGRLCRGPAIACPVRTLDPLPAFLISSTGNIRKERVGIVWMDENMNSAADLFFGTLLLTTLPRISRWLEWNLHQHKRTLNCLPRVCDCQSILEYIQSTLQNDSDSLKDWKTEQYSNQFPSSIVSSFSGFSHMVNSVASDNTLSIVIKAMISESEKALTTTGLDGREAARIILHKYILKWVDEEKVGAFCSHVILANIEELISEPFGCPNYIPTGPGSIIGCNLLNMPETLNAGRQKFFQDEANVNKKSGWQLRETELRLQSYGVDMRTRKILELKTMGYTGKSEEDGIPVHWNGRPMNVVDCDHMACKVGICYQRVSPARRSQTPSLTNNYAYPLPFMFNKHLLKWYETTLLPKGLAQIEAFESLAKNNLVPKLPEYFNPWDVDATE